MLSIRQRADDGTISEVATYNNGEFNGNKEFQNAFTIFEGESEDRIMRSLDGPDIIAVRPEEADASKPASESGLSAELDWNPSEHPRNDDGEFTDDPGGGAAGTFGGLEPTDPVDVRNIEPDSFEEEAAISDYVAGGYERVNSALRRSGSNYGPRVEETIETMNKYIDRAGEFDEATTVYRGVSANPERRQRFRESEEGDFIQLSGFQSTSHDPEVASRFTDSEDGIMLSIETDTGLPMSAVDGVNDAEDEVLLGHDRYYRVQEVTETDDGLHVKLEG